MTSAPSFCHISSACYPRTAIMFHAYSLKQSMRPWRKKKFSATIYSLVSPIPAKSVPPCQRWSQFFCIWIDLSLTVHSGRPVSMLDRYTQILIALDVSVSNKSSTSRSVYSNNSPHRIASGINLWFGTCLMLIAQMTYSCVLFSTIWE